MTSKLKGGLLAGASGLAIAFVLAAQPAHAFDKVEWSWEADVKQRVRADVEIDINLDPSGLAMVEDLQVSIGDVKASSVVNGVYNNQPNTTGGSQMVDLGNLSFTGNYDPNSGSVTGDTTATVLTDTEFLAGTVNPGSPNGVTMNYDLGTIEVQVDPSGSFNALSELPAVVSAATAVANNTSIETDTSVQLHEGQFAFGGSEGGSSNASSQIANAMYGSGMHGGNSNLTAAALLGLAGATGNIEKANISAVSRVSDIVNASVDSSATAVANNLTVTVDAEGDDRALIADAVQVSIADVNAVSRVGGVSVNSYTNLGRLDGPMVSSVATAVGNNKSISVRVPAPTVAP